MGFLSHLAILLAAASAVAAESAEAVPAVATPHITSIKYSGSGCPNDAQFSGNFNNPTVTFKDFTISSPGEKTVNCQVHLQATGASPGWQVAIKKNVVKGHLYLSPGSSLTHYTTIFFSQDASNTDTLQDTVSNTGDKTTSGGVTLVSHAGAQRVWSPCTDKDGYTGILNVNFRGALSGAGKSYFEAKTEEWELEWRRC
jgi:hypothetical protein